MWIATITFMDVIKELFRRDPKMQPLKVKAIRKGFLYDTEKAILLAGDDYMLNGNYEKGPRRNENRFLYVTMNGRYFKVLQVAGPVATVSQVTPLSIDEAVEMWSSLEKRRANFDHAFPNFQIKEA